MSAETPGSGVPWPSATRGWLVVGLLALASIMSQFDRTVINLMVAPVKAAFDLDDTHFGMLQGVAFGIFYVLACIPIGRLADRFERRWIIGTALLLWSLFAMASGLARTYTQLFLTRIGVAVGESSLTPAGFSMLSDHFPPAKLGRPMGAFMMSSPVGQGLAFIGGGQLLQWLSTSGIMSWKPLAGFEPWQAAFIIVGLPGLLLVPMFLLLREPVRRGPGGDVPMTVGEVVAVVTSRRQALLPLFAGFAMVPVVSYAIAVWTPALFQRTWQWNPAQIGWGIGLLQLTFGTCGAYFGGWLTDRFAQRGMLDAPLKAAAFGFIGCGVFGALAPLMPNAWAALALLGPTLFLGNTPYACAGTAIQLVIPNRARAQVTALYLTITNLMGMTVSPMVVGMMTDHLFHDPLDIRYSLSLVIAFTSPVLFVLLLAAGKPYRRLRGEAC